MAKNNATKNAAVRISPAPIVIAVIILSLVLAVIMLYPVAREFYLAQRENDRVNAEHQAVVNRNEAIQRQIDELQTPEGIEDRAREEFGWVREGEEAVNITGLTVSESSTGLPNAIEPGSIDAPETRWTQLLDQFFDVSEPPPDSSPVDDVVPAP
ncbi:MAG: septum formation initiator family protein [Coriobacteriales bacterium]|nr:septum formation initiator family protein [Coriobacteriales bacterium]